MSLALQNPFVTSAVLPGKLSFVFPDDNLTVKALLNQFRDAGRRGQIVGPHGSGKSTLLRNLIHQSSHNIDWIELEPTVLIRDRSLPTLHASGDSTTLAIDGMEQLPRELASEIIGWTHTHQIGLLFTCHEEISPGTNGSANPPTVPLLLRTAPYRNTFAKLIGKLTRDSNIEFARNELDQVFDRHRGDIREALFELYDQAEKICGVEKKHAESANSPHAARQMRRR